MESKQKRQTDCGVAAASTVNLNKENTVIIRPKVSLDKSEAISKAKQERMDRITEQKFADYCQDTNRFLKGRVFVPDSEEYKEFMILNRKMSAEHLSCWQNVCWTESGSTPIQVILSMPKTADGIM